jgi:hypothetical protein
MVSQPPTPMAYVGDKDWVPEPTPCVCHIRDSVGAVPRSRRDCDDPVGIWAQRCRSPHAAACLVALSSDGPRHGFPNSRCNKVEACATRPPHDFARRSIDSAEGSHAIAPANHYGRRPGMDNRDTDPSSSHRHLNCSAIAASNRLPPRAFRP